MTYSRQSTDTSEEFGTAHAMDFDSLYATSTPPWEIGRPQQAFVELAHSGKLQGRVLDVGCGSGEHALLAAELGLDATGVDASPTAIAHAHSKAARRGLAARFLVHNALDLGSLKEQFDTVLDCGLFHIFLDVDRSRYVDSLAAVMPPGAHYYMLCFSDRQPGTRGPRRISQAEITEAFEKERGWKVESIQPTFLASTVDPPEIHAWLAHIIRTD